MNAKEARQLTEDNLNGPITKPYLDVIFDRIKKAAEDGKYEINHPFDGVDKVPLPYPANHIQKSILAKLTSLGYQVTHHEGDPSDPREAPYKTVSW